VKSDGKKQKGFKKEMEFNLCLNSYLDNWEEEISSPWAS
jgi:hypothetical protein